MFTGREFQSVRTALDEIPIVDTHEHYGEKWNSPTTSLYDLFRDSYVTWVAHDEDLEENPESLRAWLEPSWTNSYTVSLIRALREIYGLEQRELEEIPFDRLGEQVSRAYQDPSWGLGLLRRAGIHHTIVDPLPVPGYVHDEPSFHLALRSHMLVHGYDRSARDHGGDNPFEFAARFGKQLDTFADYVEYVDFWVREHQRKGAVAIKSALAYERDIE
ncbi:MAG: hypothetical protein JXA57_11780, partial [Armatimonadetes bacterium]|nr:hypothetical protein [Armatimonadota bacterium]